MKYGPSAAIIGVSVVAPLAAVNEGSWPKTKEISSAVGLGRHDRIIAAARRHIKTPGAKYHVFNLSTSYALILIRSYVSICSMCYV